MRNKALIILGPALRHFLTIISAYYVPRAHFKNLHARETNSVRINILEIKLIHEVNGGIGIYAFFLNAFIILMKSLSWGVITRESLNVEVIFKSGKEGCFAKVIPQGEEWSNRVQVLVVLLSEFGTVEVQNGLQFALFSVQVGKGLVMRFSVV